MKLFIGSIGRDPSRGLQIIAQRERDCFSHLTLFKRQLNANSQASRRHCYDTEVRSALQFGCGPRGQFPREDQLGHGLNALSERVKDRREHARWGRWPFDFGTNDSKPKRRGLLIQSHHPSVFVEFTPKAPDVLQMPLRQNSKVPGIGWLNLTPQSSQRLIETL